MEQIFLKARDGYKLNVHVFEVKNAKAAIQIIHGMEEHQERYEEVVDFLNKNGYSVISSDMRGHGSTAPNLGFFKTNNGYKELIADQKTITKFIKEKFNGLPIYILAHSMGTIITRVLLQKNSKDYSKVILSGYPNYQSAAHFGIIAAGLIKLFYGAKHKSHYINKLSVGSFNKLIENPKTDYDWICKNEDVVKAYIKDPYCGIGFTCSAYSDLFHLVVLMHNHRDYKKVNSEMPILMLKGNDDPCVGGEEGAKDSREVLIKAGFKNVCHIDYPNMRHEIMAEKEKQEVFDDILAFYNNA